MPKLPFEMGMAHYDAPPPDVIGDLEPLRANDGFRFANELRAWIEVSDDGRIVGWDHAGRGHIGSTTVRLGKCIVFSGVPFPEIRPEPSVSETAVRFVQTAGGRTGLPAPRRVRRKLFFQMAAPLGWSTLALTIHADGTSEFEVLGASPFPRHWVYDQSGRLAAKTGMIDFKEWYRRAFGSHTPWGDEDSPALVTMAETALERQLSGTLMREGKPKVRKVREGRTLVNQGDPGTDLICCSTAFWPSKSTGRSWVRSSPVLCWENGSVLKGGARTSTLRAVTPRKVAVAPADRIDRDSLVEVAEGHRREDAD